MNNSVKALLIFGAILGVAALFSGFVRGMLCGIVSLAIGSYLVYSLIGGTSSGFYGPNDRED